MIFNGIIPKLDVFRNFVMILQPFRSPLDGGSHWEESVNSGRKTSQGHIFIFQLQTH